MWFSRNYRWPKPSKWEGFASGTGDAQNFCLYTSGQLRAPVSAFLLRLYLKFPQLWWIKGKQFLAVARCLPNWRSQRLLPDNAVPLKLLSIVIPARDEEGCIAATVEHLHLELKLNQVPHEIVVVDDGSKGSVPGRSSGVEITQAHSRVITFAE